MENVECSGNSHWWFYQRTVSSSDFVIGEIGMNRLFKSASMAASLVLFAEVASAQTILQSEPAPGQLQAGEVVYVACGPGKAMKVTGGSHIKSGVMTSQGTKRQRGPCVAMKN
jgi:hypothetical protein